MMDIIPRGATVISITENTVVRSTIETPIFLSTVSDRAAVTLVGIEGKIYELYAESKTGQAVENPGSPYAPLLAA